MRAFTVLAGTAIVSIMAATAAQAAPSDGKAVSSPSSEHMLLAGSGGGGGGGGSGGAGSGGGASGGSSGGDTSTGAATGGTGTGTGAPAGTPEKPEAPETRD